MHIRKSLVAPLALFSLLTTICYAQSVRRWDFNTLDEREGWEVRADAGGVVMGGSLWLRITSTAMSSARLYESIGQKVSVDYDEMMKALIASPRNLQIPAGRTSQVRLRVLNFSPISDFLVQWRTEETNWGPRDWRNGRFLDGLFDLPPQSARCAVEPDTKRWQEVTCYISAHGTIDQIQIGSLIPVSRGDLWIDWIEIGKGAPSPSRPRPDVASSRVVPKVTIPRISQAGFADAFKVLDEALVIDVPASGFTHPFMSAGGNYREYWWFALDSSLAVDGAKWANEGFVEGVMRGFRDLQAQNADGRIDMYSGSLTRGLMTADLSQTPRFFEAAYDVARRANDPALRAEIYDTMRQFLDWWLSPVKRDKRTGLISGTFEDGDTLGETPGWSNPPAVAPVDLNVAVAVAAAYTADLAARLGKKEDAARYSLAFQELSRSINSILWDEKDGAYYNYDLTAGQPRRRMIVSTFDPLRLGIASVEHRNRLIQRLLDPSQFNWGRVPLTSLVKTDPGYVEVKGQYRGEAWQGGVWTIRNMEVIQGLEESGRPDLAADLNWATIKAFHQNYYEFLNPADGSGQGTARYTATASQYIGAIIEHLFGVDFDAIEKRTRIAPHVPKELYGQDIELDDLILPTGGDTRLSVKIIQSAPTAAVIRVNVTGTLPKGDLIVVLPGTAKENRVSMRRSFIANFQ